MIEKILIANRGEIALRIARTCRELGITSVAVHSTADRDSAVVRAADESVQIGPPSAQRSYLNMAAIVEAALVSGADAIHPGYGFLSEDPDIAEICADNGLVFIGPEPNVMALLGDKAAARLAMRDAGLPILPGSTTAVDEELAVRLAGDIGYPVIIKAVAGGGGRGMAVVAHPEQFRMAYRSTRSAAATLFGDGRICLERYLRRAHHIEIQLLCDATGNAVHLGERDCSVQRRRQKLLEETPSPVIDPELAERIATAALAGTAAVGYRGLGTFEFLVDGETGDFFFIEANCRIQVEHPVTEMVTGIDLVRAQLAVAAGGQLSLRQEDVQRRGVAVECRINAEDPDRAFLPTPGLIEEFVPPGGPFVRVDTHAVAGMLVSPNYDPLLAKIITWAPDRDQALDRMDRALGETRVRGAGVCTTTEFLRRVLAHPEFRKGVHTTSLVDERLSSPTDS